MTKKIEFTNEQLSKIREMFDQYFTGREIAKEINVSLYVIQRIIKEMKLQYVPRKIIFTNEQKERIIELLEQGFGSTTISKEMLVSNTYMKNYLNKNNLKRKTSKQRIPAERKCRNCFK